MESEPDRKVLEDAIRSRWPEEADKLISLAKWDHIGGCWMLPHAGHGVVYGIEKDGYIHS